MKQHCSKKKHTNKKEQQKQREGKRERKRAQPDRARGKTTAVLLAKCEFANLT